ncbi:MAG: ABC transporter permease subunit/CPBP intramembrane protease [Planctomycetales bacterium]
MDPSPTIRAESHPIVTLPSPSANPHERLRRLVRLSLKELREILRDRRTIVTLVLMPLLLYPLLSVAFQQVFAAQWGTLKTRRYYVAFRDDAEGQVIAELLRMGGLPVADETTEPVAAREGDRRPAAVVEFEVRPQLDQALSRSEVHVGLRVSRPPRLDYDPREDVAVDVDLLYRADWLESAEAARLVEEHLRAAGDALLKTRLNILRIMQRPVPIQVTRREVEDAETSLGAPQLTVVIPFILILMTVTGAVYPAIDLTAGERERGTLEVLVAAPIPRIGVLFAKYVAVLTVALLTAAANLLTMTITLYVSGLGARLFGGAGFSWGVIGAVFALLLLFAAFFSAVLLVITSCARSFKEAQAYLIPLMLLALAPGVLSLIPGLKLSTPLLVTPLANIVLLGRELFALRATGGQVMIVVASTILYAGAAIGLAARIFGAEGVLYSNQPGWSDLVRRPRQTASAPTLTAALVCLALMFPSYFLLMNLLGRAEGTGARVVLGGVITSVVFGLLPFVSCWLRRVSIGGWFQIPASRWTLAGAAILLGLSLWTVDHEVVTISKSLRGVTLDASYLDLIQKYAASLRTLPAWAVIFGLAIIPAVFEEGFFRGYLFGALRSATSPRTSIILSAIAFGLFHGIMPNPLAQERVLSSALTGLVLGWIRWRTGSVLPGLLLHACHNGLLMLLVYYEPQLAALGLGESSQTHLPWPWSVTGGLAVVAGLVTIHWRCPPGRESS